jgi:hypothetical protein
MCHPADSWSAALLLMFFLSVAIHSLFQSRFLKQLERLHHDDWEELLHQDAWSEETSATYSAGLWYLLSGEYRSLGDGRLARSAFRARLAAIVSVVMLASWGVFAAITHASPSLRCLLGFAA